MAVAVSGDPRPVVHRLARRQQRPVHVQHVAAEPEDRPAGERHVGDIRVDEVEVARVVDRHVSLVAEIVLLERQHREARQVRERLSAVARGPCPRHAAREGRRVEVGRERELPVLLVGGDEDVPVAVGDRGRLIAEAEVRRHLDRRVESRARAAVGDRHTDDGHCGERSQRGHDALADANHVPPRR